jgi:CIC family chloride channel protein
MLMIAAAYGTLVGEGLNRALPGPTIALGAFAVVAMAATFGAATRATFTSIVFVFELTRNYNVVVPLMAAVALADLVFNALSEHSIMTEKLHRRGLNVGRFYGVDPLVTTTVAEVMSEPNGSAPTATPVSSSDRVIVALDVMLEEHVGEVAVVDDGELVGVISHADVLKTRRVFREHERLNPAERWQLRRRR